MMKIAFKFIRFFTLSSLVFLFTQMTFAKQCKLQPDGFDGSDASIEQFEKNMATEMTKIYRKDYPLLKRALRKAAKLEDQFSEMESSLLFDFVATTSKINDRQGTSTRSRRLRFKKRLRRLVAQEFIVQADLAEINEMLLRKEFKLEHILEYQKKRQEFQIVLDEIDDKVQALKAPHILYKPKISARIRGKGTVYANLQFEGFVRPPADNMLMLPFIGAGFETDGTTIIYACIHLDAKNTKNNALYIYFMNTTKFIAVRWYDYITNINLSIRKLFTYNSEPKAQVSPVVLKYSPLSSVQYIFQNISFLKPFAFINQFLQELGIVEVAAAPVMKFVMDNVGIGIKGVHLEENNIKVRYGVSTLFQLVQFNLIDQNIGQDLSPFLNVLAQPSYEGPKVLVGDDN